MDTNTPEVILNDDTTTDLTVLSHEFANAESRECNSTTVTEVPPVIKLIQAYASLIEASSDIATTQHPRCGLSHPKTRTQCFCHPH